MEGLGILHKPEISLNGINPVWLMNISHMLIEVYLFIHVSLLPVFIKSFSLSIFEVSLVVTGPRVFSLLVSLVSGALIDKVGAKPILVLGMFSQAIGGILVAISWDIITLFIGITFINIASPLYHNSGLSTISRFLDGKKLNGMMGIHNALGSLGSAIALFLLPIILLYGDWRLAYLIWIPPILIWAILLIGTKHIDSKISRKKTNLSIKLIFRKNFVKYLVALSFSFAASTAITTYITSYLVFEKNLTEAISSLIFAIGPILGIFASLFSGKIAGTVGEKRLITIIMFFSALSIILIPLSSSTILLASLYVVFAFLSSAIWPPVSALTAKLTPVSFRGVGYSLTTSTYQLIFAVTPPIVAKLVELYSLEIIFPTSFILTVSSLILLQIVSIKQASSNNSAI
ncbi:MAG: MFS transporter [Nitrososphaeria archaeon]